ncbi:F-box/kelch-repeat protein At3g23880 [Jatropha curcas]|uniref:F-box/kelch-repeat protein At3g23880 n=1 Tax=Jatropha curcas TaxID=180498 RepID=UPI001895F71F|nr:F-box/kelch-repeat protein At3g23880 [Jatropha curcas]
MSDYLPEGVIIQILQKLPVKSLIRCISVCKLWYSLIKNPNFISTQIANTSWINTENNPNPVLLLHFHAGEYSLVFDNQELEDITLHFPFCKLWYSLIKNPNFISTQIANTSWINTENNPNPVLLLHFHAGEYSLVFDNQELEDITLHFPSKSGSRFFRAVGYSNGLLCISIRHTRCDYGSDNYNDEFILWNPSIRKSFALPQPNFTFLTSCHYCNDYVGFGFDSNSNDYKVCRMKVHQPYCEKIQEPKIQIEIYSFNMNSWKIITGNAPERFDKKQVNT